MGSLRPREERLGRMGLANANGLLMAVCPRKPHLLPPHPLRSLVP